MKSLFLRIFISFWVALALCVVIAIIVTIALRPRSSTWEALRTTVLNDSVSAYEEGGQQGLREYFENLDHSQHVRAFLFDEHGNELSGHGAPDWAMRMAAGGPRIPHDGFIFPAPPMQRDSRASSDGKHRYTLVLGLPPGPRVFFGPRGLPVPFLIIAIISSGIVCYLLAWYMTKPIVRLRTATRQLAAGDLSARTGAPATARSDEVAGLMRDFDAMAERIETLLKAQSRLLNDISHELRSPLARLNVALGLARQRAERVDRQNSYPGATGRRRAVGAADSSSAGRTGRERYRRRGIRSAGKELSRAYDDPRRRVDRARECLAAAQRDRDCRAQRDPLHRRGVVSGGGTCERGAFRQARSRVEGERCGAGRSGGRAGEAF